MGKEDINLGRIENNTGSAFCGWQGCQEIGKFRAPISRQNLNQFYWFCLEHVRLYNSNWNYCEGMSEQCFEDLFRADATWNRPTWPMTSGTKIGVYLILSTNILNNSKSSAQSSVDYQKY